MTTLDPSVTLRAAAPDLAESIADLR